MHLYSGTEQNGAEHNVLVVFPKPKLNLSVLADQRVQSGPTLDHFLDQVSVCLGGVP